MKRFFYLLMLCMFFVGCEPADYTTTQTKEEVTQTVRVSSTKIKVTHEGQTKCIFYEFTYKGHLYISNYSKHFLLHSPSCPCHNTPSLFNSNLQTSGSSLFN